MTNPRTFWVKCLGNNYKYKNIIISIAELNVMKALITQSDHQKIL